MRKPDALSRHLAPMILNAKKPKTIGFKTLRIPPLDFATNIKGGSERIGAFVVPASHLASVSRFLGAEATDIAKRKKFVIEFRLTDSRSIDEIARLIEKRYASRLLEVMAPLVEELAKEFEDKFHVEHEAYAASEGEVTIAPKRGGASVSIAFDADVYRLRSSWVERDDSASDEDADPPIKDEDLADTDISEDDEMIENSKI